MKIVKANLLVTFSSERYSKIPIHDTQGLLRLLCLEQGQSVPLHKHPSGDEYFYVIEGKGKIKIRKKEAEAETGCVIKAPAGVLHQWKSDPQKLVLLSVVIPLQSYKVADEALKMEFV
ncbi:MAG: cupin domain-containing protein [Candidatus Bathycorpusculaceae bacterium]